MPDYKKKASSSWGYPYADEPGGNFQTQAVAFSMSGRSGLSEYFDSGVRYDFKIENGRAFYKTVNSPWSVVAPQGKSEPEFLSFVDSRKGTLLTGITFDMIAASGGRAIAKQSGKQRFFITCMDNTFLKGNVDSRTSTVVPSTFFALDPEFNPGRPGKSLDEVFGPNWRGNYFDHPAGERFMLFDKVFQAGVMDFMLVELKKGTWLEVNTQAPIFTLGNPDLGLLLKKRMLPEILQVALAASIAGKTGPANASVLGLNKMLERLKEAAANPPAWLKELQSPKPTTAVKGPLEFLSAEAGKLVGGIKVFGDAINYFAEAFKIDNPEMNPMEYWAKVGPKLEEKIIKVLMYDKEREGGTFVSAPNADINEVSVNVKALLSYLARNMSTTIPEAEAKKTPPAPAQDIFNTYGFPSRTSIQVEGTHLTKPVEMKEIAFSKVLGMGAGHVHWHERYELKYGGEIQPVRLGMDALQGAEQVSLAYRFMNGPVRDGDGFIDGTANFYLLVKLAKQVGLKQTHAVLFADEQFYFSGRWRLLHPFKDAAPMSIMGLLSDPSGRPHDFNPDCFWDPCEDGLIGDQSRMSVARQVIVLSSQDFQEFYTINFSWGSSDYSWRCRSAKPTQQTKAIGGLTWDNSTGDVSYPQSLRMREDMTLCMKGKKGGVNGYWFQPYLRAGSELFPHRSQLSSAPPPTSSGPTRPRIKANKPQMDNRPWSFMTQTAFESADQFSHICAYQTVRARNQYYKIKVNDHAAMLEAHKKDPMEQERHWTASWDDLYISRMGLNWRNPPAGDFFKVKNFIKKDGKGTCTSMFNKDLRFKLSYRGALGWIATFADKRDDDLAPLTGMGKTVPLKKTEFFLSGANKDSSGVIDLDYEFSSRTVKSVPLTLINRIVPTGLRPAASAEFQTVQFQENRTVEGAPRIKQVTVELLQPANPAAGIAVTLRTDLFQADLAENVWAVYMAGLEGSGENVKVVPILAAWRENHFSLHKDNGDGTFDYRAVFEKGSSALIGGTDAIGKFCTQKGRVELGTSIWFEDAVGHVAPADETIFSN